MNSKNQITSSTVEPSELLVESTPELTLSLQEVMNSLHDHVWIKDLNGIYTFCNSSVQEAWGLKSSEIVGKNDYEIFEAELAKKFIDADNVILESGVQTVVEECGSTDSDKPDIWLETIKTRVLRTDGLIYGVMGMTRNVTRRKLVESQLSVASKIFNNSKEGMMVTDAKGNIIDINQAFTEITGYSNQEVIGRNPKLLQSGHHNASFYVELWDQLKQNGIWKGEIINRRKNDSIYPQMTTVSSICDEYNNILNYVGVFEDVSFRKAHEEKLERMAFYDPLTNLPNRASLIRFFASYIKESQENGTPFTTLFLDIDHFKQINDSLGHFAGDKVLTDLAKRLKGAVRQSDFVARLGGDEFVIVLANIDYESGLDAVINKLLGLFDHPFKQIQGESLRLSTSIGISVFPRDGEDGEVLLKNADTAMYQAKQNGRNGYSFYSPSQSSNALSYIRIKSALHEALENDQFSLVYQPQYQLDNNVLVGLEALIRWHHPEMGTIPPLEFISIAEKTGLIDEIGMWVLNTACEQGVQWLKNGYEFGRIAVNISSQQLINKDFVSSVQEVLNRTGFPTSCLELEITEGTIMRDPEKAVADLNALCDLGIEIALDDFGTGYSSLAYLKKLPLHKLKIDRSFVKDIPDDSDSNAITDAILALGQTLSLTVIAEGLECEHQIEFLVDKGCMLGQGYHLGRPAIAVDIESIFY